MGQRLQLHEIFVGFLGTRNVYFQPPETLKMQYPCIVYQRDYIDTQFANDGPYSLTKRYMVTVIDRDPDSLIPDKVSKMKMCLFQNHFTTEDLNHDVFRLYF